jgi:glycosyltransferase involved in cell wall biosynthesis
MKLSILFPVKDRTKYLPQSIGSVLTCLPELAGHEHELILGDNASTQDVAGAALRICPEIRVTRHTEDLGIFGNMNALIQASTGDWIHIVHDDDWIIPGFYARFLSALKESPEVGIVSILPRIVNEQTGQEAAMQRSFDRGGIQKQDAILAHLYAGTSFSIIGMIVARWAYDLVGPFDQSIPHSADWQKWKELAAVVPWYYCQDSLCRFRFHDESMTAKYQTMGEVPGDIRRAIAMDVVPDRLREIHRLAVMGWASSIANDAKIYIGNNNLANARICLAEALKILDYAN